MTLTEGYTTVPKLLTVREAAAILRISPRGLYNAISEGNPPVQPVRVGKRRIRFRASDINDLVKGE